jgi:hypothetical protein
MDARIRPVRESDPFAKYSGGFQGNFASMADFHGGLDSLIGEPAKDVDQVPRPTRATLWQDLARITICRG